MIRDDVEGDVGLVVAFIEEVIKIPKFTGPKNKLKLIIERNRKKSK